MPANLTPQYFAAKNRLSAEDQLMQLIRELVNLLNIVRVYSRHPGHEAEIDFPPALPAGSPLMDFASAVHKDFATNLTFARVWGARTFPGQRINHDYVIEDGDVIELHIRVKKSFKSNSVEQFSRQHVYKFTDFEHNQLFIKIEA